MSKLTNLSVRQRRKNKRAVSERQTLTASRHVNDSWSMDFVMDGRKDAEDVSTALIQPDLGGHVIGVFLAWEGQRPGKVLTVRNPPQALRTAGVAITIEIHADAGQHAKTGLIRQIWP